MAMMRIVAVCVAGLGLSWYHWSCQGMVDAVVDTWGKLDIGVNNAGVNKNSAAEETPIEDWDLTFELNTKGVFMCCQVHVLAATLFLVISTGYTALPLSLLELTHRSSYRVPRVQAQAKHMLPRGYGKIINTASMASLLVPHPQKQAAYNSSKAAVVKMTQSLATEWADRGVRVNCMSPGIVNTPLIWENPALKDLAGIWLDQIPSKRLAEVTDLQAGLVYLASDTSDYMIGHNLVICGGQELW